MVEEYRKTEPGYELAIEGVLNSLVSLMIRTLPIRKIPDAESIPGENQTTRDWVKRIIDYVQEHYHEKISLTDMASSAAYISPYYLSHFFKEKIGVSFLEYVNFVRLKNTISYLSEKHKKITDIALDCGFGSIKAFNVAFKKQYGVTPRVYRKSRDYYSVVADQPGYTKFDSLFVVQKLQKYIQDYMVAQINPPLHTFIPDGIAASTGSGAAGRKPGGYRYDGYRRDGAVPSVPRVAAACGGGPGI
ncbi:putative HTH-type transcriptional activator RhaS [Hollandina sp. SP2]